MSAYFPPGPAPAPAPPTVPAGTRSGTVWVWLIVGLPVLAGVVGIGAIAEMQRVFPMIFELWPTEYDAATADAFEAEIVRLYVGLFFSPWVWGAFILGWGGSAATVWFAVLDVRELRARGFVRPFHWGWSFLGSIVYVIGRHVVIRRRGGSDRAPLVVMIVTQSLAFGIGMYMGIMLNLEMLSFVLSITPRA